MQRILTLDLSVARTGYAIAAPDEQPLRFGSYPLPSTGPDIGKLLARYDEWLRTMLAGEDVCLIVFEAPILRPGRTDINTARKLLNLAGHTELVGYNLGIRCAEHHIGQNKKTFTGNGNADKAEMVRVARMYGWDVANHDEADACALWLATVLERFPQHAAGFKLGALGSVRAA